jgi:tellurite resistance protein
MKEKTDLRLKNAEKVSKETLIDKIKSTDQTRFDQMLIESEERKNYFFVQHNSVAYTRTPKTLKFPLFKDLVNDFESNIEQRGDATILEKDGIIQKIISKGKEPINTPKYSGKNLIFSDLKLVTENDKVNLKQPIYYLPNETERCTCNTCKGDMYTTCKESECHGQHIYDCSKCRTSGKLDCDDCNARGEYTCPSCSGRGALKCSFCSGSGRDSKSGSILSKCKQCNGSGERKCSSINYGKGSGLLGAAVSGVAAGVKKAAGNEYCGGTGIIRCKTCSTTGKITCDKCEGDGRIECKTCHGDHVDNRYGKVDCVTCETAGELASISYIETEIKTSNLDLIFTDGKKIEAPNFGVETLKKYVNSNAQTTQIYKNLNGNLIENYDQYSTFCSKSALTEIGASKERYPKLIQEEIYYEGVPCATFNYNHILSATHHEVSVLSIDKEQDVLFHSNPTAVAEEKETIKQKIGELLRKAFSTKSFKDKIDRKHEMFLMVHMAKADGVIEEQEKKYLAQTITGLHGFTNKEKAELFGLMSANILPPISPQNAYFSSKERAEESQKKIIELVAKADGDYEPVERAKIEEINNAIQAGHKEKPSALWRFFKTWQVSVSIITIFLSITFLSLWLIFVLPIKQAESKHQELLKEAKKVELFLEAKEGDWEMDMIFDKSDAVRKINKLIHESTILFDNEGKEISYNDFWTQKREEYLIKLDSLDTSKNTENNIEEISENSISNEMFTVNDPDGWSNMRKTPNGIIIQKVMNGDLFYVLSVEGKFKKVKLGNGKIGYIHSSRVISEEEYMAESEAESETQMNENETETIEEVIEY